jgi:hypothetical protein
VDFRKGALINNGIEKICHNHSCQNILVKVLGKKKYSAKFYSVIFTIIKLVSKKKNSIKFLK